LLTLVTVSVAPCGSLVVYGQPGVGIVIIRVSEEKKHEAALVLEEMREAT